MKYKQLLKSLRNGAVPQDGVEHIFVGNKKQLNELLNELDFVEQDNNSTIRFISGEYGSGKTMLTTLLMKKALEKNFAISKVIINPGLSLGNFQDIYRVICHNLKTTASGEGSGIVEILETWSYNQFKIFKSIEGINDNVKLSKKQIDEFHKQIETELIVRRSIDVSFAKAIASFSSGKISRNHELTKYALDWIRASDKIPAKDYSKELGLKGKISGEDAYNFFQGLLKIVKEANYKGLLIIIDEVETIRRIPKKNLRHKAYETIRHILDDVYSGKLNNSFFVITGTPELFENRQGIKEYQALAERISRTNKSEIASIKQPIIKLNRFSYEELLKLGIKIVKIYNETVNFDIESRMKNDLKKIIKRLAENFDEIDSDPRQFIREFINVLDLLNDDPNKKISEIISIEE